MLTEYSTAGANVQTNVNYEVNEHTGAIQISLLLLAFITSPVPGSSSSAAYEP